MWNEGQWASFHKVHKELAVRRIKKHELRLVRAKMKGNLSHFFKVTWYPLWRWVLVMFQIPEALYEQDRIPPGLQSSHHIHSTFSENYQEYHLFTQSWSVTHTERLWWWLHSGESKGTWGAWHWSLNAFQEELYNSARYDSWNVFLKTCSSHFYLKDVIYRLINTFSIGPVATTQQVGVT